MRTASRSLRAKFLHRESDFPVEVWKNETMENERDGRRGNEILSCFLLL